MFLWQFVIPLFYLLSCSRVTIAVRSGDALGLDLDEVSHSQPGVDLKGIPPSQHSSESDFDTELRASLVESGSAKNITMGQSPTTAESLASAPHSRTFPWRVFSMPAINLMESMASVSADSGEGSDSGEVSTKLLALAVLLVIVILLLLTCAGFLLSTILSLQKKASETCYDASGELLDNDLTRRLAHEIESMAIKCRGTTGKLPRRSLPSMLGVVSERFMAITPGPETSGALAKIPGLDTSTAILRPWLDSSLGWWDTGELYYQSTPPKGSIPLRSIKKIDVGKDGANQVLITHYIEGEANEQKLTLQMQNQRESSEWCQNLRRIVSVIKKASKPELVGQTGSSASGGTGSTPVNDRAQIALDLGRSRDRGQTA